MAKGSTKTLRNFLSNKTGQRSVTSKCGQNWLFSGTKKTDHTGSHLNDLNNHVSHKEDFLCELQISSQLTNKYHTELGIQIRIPTDSYQSCVSTCPGS